DGADRADPLGGRDLRGEQAERNHRADLAGHHGCDGRHLAAGRVHAAVESGASDAASDRALRRSRAAQVDPALVAYLVSIVNVPWTMDAWIPAFAGMTVARARWHGSRRATVPDMSLQYVSRSGRMSRNIVVAISSIDLCVDDSQAMPSRRIIDSASRTS